jgi:cytoskeleton protein RodZ
MSGKIVAPEATGDQTGDETVHAEVGTALPEAEHSASVGEQLRAGREARALTINDVAKALKLSPKQIDALEADDWVRLPCNTISRGFVRNYARLLELDAGRLMSALDRLQMPLTPELEMPAGTNVSVPQEGRVQRRDFIRVLASLVVLVLAVGAYFFLPPDVWHSTLATLKSTLSSKPVERDSSEPAPTESKEGVASAAAPANESVPAPGVAAPDISVRASAPSAEPAPFAAAPAAAPATPTLAVTGSGLKLSFAQASWVEVRDRSGEIVFSQLCQPGTQREIEGRPPFALVVGNATHVSAFYKGKPVDLSKRSKDDVARVTVE